MGTGLLMRAGKIQMGPAGEHEKSSKHLVIKETNNIYSIYGLH